MYRVCLTEEQRQQLAERTQHKTTAPKMRARLEMLRLSDKGWIVPRIAAHLDVHKQTVVGQRGRMSVAIGGRGEQPLLSHAVVRVRECVGIRLRDDERSVAQQQTIGCL